MTRDDARQPTHGQQQLIEGVYRHRLAEHAKAVLDDPSSAQSDRSGALQAIDTCAKIEQRLRADEHDLVEVLAAAGVRGVAVLAPVDRQYHTIRITVDDVAAAELAATALELVGFVAWEQWHGAARRSFLHHGTELTVARTADVTTVVRITWAASRGRSRLARIVTPTAGDWSMVQLPPLAWRGYSAVRLMRLVAERLHLRRRNENSLGPFLSTPDSLLSSLLEFADVDSDDTVVDLGCGDGRIVVRAAELTQCSGVGVESAPSLVSAARERAASAGVADRVTIEQADARDIDLDAASVVFMFLPIDVVADIIEATLSKMRTGAVLVVHEQSRLPVDFPVIPTRSLVLADGAVTVAHRFVA